MRNVLDVLVKTDALVAPPRCSMFEETNLSLLTLKAIRNREAVIESSLKLNGVNKSELLFALAADILRNQKLNTICNISFDTSISTQKVLILAGHACYSIVADIGIIFQAVRNIS
jgi:hypothetical protein